MWRELYLTAMLESDWNKLQPLLEDAINEVLDQIEEARTRREIEELNNALNGLRSRRRQVVSWRAQCCNLDQPKAA
jgi:hypothetical protein